MQRRIYFTLLLLIMCMLWPSPSLSAAVMTPKPPTVTGAAWIVMDATSGQVLGQHNAEQAMPMASTTKLMTSLLLAEQMELTETIWIPYEVRGVDGSKLYLEPGERYTAQDMLAALMIASANDAAIATAVNVGGSEARFVAMMNQRAAELGMTHTNFKNPHGLDTEGHVASATDLAILAQAVLRNPIMNEAVKLTNAVIPAPALGVDRTLNSHNRFLVHYRWAIGGKTGFTNQAQYCLVAMAQQGDTTLVAVMLGGDAAHQVAQEMELLLTWGFENFKPHALIDPSRTFQLEQPTDDGSVTLAMVPAEPITALLPDGELVKSELIDMTVDGDQLIVSYGGKRIGSTSLVPLETSVVDAAQSGAANARTSTPASRSGAIWVYTSFVLLVIVLFKLRRRRRRASIRYRWRR